MRYNKSKTYLLPLISEVVGLEMPFMKNLINTYMFDEDSQYRDCIGILHEFSFKNPSFTAYEHRLINNNLFVTSKDVGDKVLYIFRFPEEYLKEYYKLVEGKYSEFGNDAKELILRFWAEVYNGNSGAISFLISVKQILYKDTKLREKLEKDLNVKIDENQELGDILDIDRETFKINEFNGNTAVSK